MTKMKQHKFNQKTYTYTTFKKKAVTWKSIIDFNKLTFFKYIYATRKDHESLLVVFSMRMRCAYHF